MSKKWSRVINAGQVRREFIDIYYRPRHGHRARQARTCGVCEESRRKERETSHPRHFTLGTHVCTARTILHASLPVYRIHGRKWPTMCRRAWVLPSIHSYAFNRVFVDIFYVNLVCIVQRDLVLYSGCCHIDPDKFEGERYTIIWVIDLSNC